MGTADGSVWGELLGGRREVVVKMLGRADWGDGTRWQEGLQVWVERVAAVRLWVVHGV